ncbi:MAG: hypothetical protein ABR570_04025 [Burkholderiales bacterium]
MRNVRRNAVFASTVTVLICFVAACGGGGGGGGSADTGLTYSGNINAAVITTSNASQITADVMGGNAASAVSSLSGVAVSGTSPGPSLSPSLASFGQRVLQASRSAELVTRGATSSARAGASVDETVACDDGGSIHVVGSVNDSTLTGTITATFNSCRTGGDMLNGQASLRVDAFDTGHGIIIDATLAFLRATFIGPDANVDFSGSFRLQIDIANNRLTFTENLVARDNVTARMLMVDNLVIVRTYVDVLARGSYTEAIGGRLYDSVHGFVQIATPVALVFSNSDQSFPSGGQLVLTGANSASVRVTALSQTLLTVELDLDGISGYEVNATLKWTDFGTAVASDLGDDDHDGMHNSWETANGLLPNNPGDAGLDPDVDGFTNLAEYRAGSDPRNKLSVPAP